MIEMTAMVWPVCTVCYCSCCMLLRVCCFADHAHTSHPFLYALIVCPIQDCCCFLRCEGCAAAIQHANTHQHACMTCIVSVLVCISNSATLDLSQYRWHAAGRSTCKMNSVLDLEACLDHLLHKGTAPAPPLPCTSIAHQSHLFALLLMNKHSSNCCQLVP